MRPGGAILLLVAVASCRHHDATETPAVDPPDEPFRATRPAVGTPRPFGIPAVQRFMPSNGADVILVEPPGRGVGGPGRCGIRAVRGFMLSNGGDVILVERQALPMVSWTITFPGGSLADPPGKEGRGSLCATLMVREQGPTANLLAATAS